VRSSEAVIVKASGRVLCNKERLRIMPRHVEEVGTTPTACSQRSVLGGGAMVLAAGEGEHRLQEVLHDEGHERKEPQHEIKVGNVTGMGAH
jgi:hypothetical protein